MSRVLQASLSPSRSTNRKRNKPQAEIIPGQWRLRPLTGLCGLPSGQSCFQFPTDFFKITAGQYRDQAVYFFDTLIPPSESEHQIDQLAVKTFPEYLCRIADHNGVRINITSDNTVCTNNNTVCRGGSPHSDRSIHHSR